MTSYCEVILWRHHVVTLEFSSLGGVRQSQHYLSWKTKFCKHWKKVKKLKWTTFCVQLTPRNSFPKMAWKHIVTLLWYKSFIFRFFPCIIRLFMKWFTMRTPKFGMVKVVPYLCTIRSDGHIQLVLFYFVFIVQEMNKWDSECGKSDKYPPLSRLRSSESCRWNIWE